MSGSGRRLGEVVEYSQGAIPYKTKADGQANLHISATRKAGWRALIESADQVSEYGTPVAAAYINYGPWLWCAREARFFNQDKILFHRVRKKLPRQLVGTLDLTGAINRHSLSNLVLREHHDPRELRAVLALFNSATANWWFAKRFGPLMEVGGFKVETIPLPAEWDHVWPKLAAQAETLLDSVASLKNAKPGPARIAVARKVEAARAKIEKILASGFGLTDNEAKAIRVGYKRLLERSETP